MATRYDVKSSRWSSQFWVKVHVFSTSFKSKKNLVACKTSRQHYYYYSPAIQLTTNWTVIVVMLSTCCPVRFVIRSTLGQQQQNLGLGLTIIRPVLERIQGFLLRVETRMIFCIDIFLARDTMVLRMSVYS